jgi:uncharacterized membrane protein YidH (DUF202 family)
LWRSVSHLIQNATLLVSLARIFGHPCGKNSNQQIQKVILKGTHMKPATIVGVILILVGIVGFALGGFSFTHEKKDIDAGPIQISHEQKKTVPIPPILSVIALVGGIGLVVVGVRSK